MAALSFTFVNPCSQQARHIEKKPSQEDKIYDVAVVYPEFVTRARTHDADGELALSEVSVVTAKMNGTIEKILVHVGDMVQNNDPLLGIRQSDVLDELDLKKAKIKEYLARLEAARNQLADDGPDKPVSNEDVQFLDEDPAANLPPQREAGVAEDKPTPRKLKDLVEVLNAEVERLTLEADAIEKNLTELMHQSPVTGVVTEVLVSEQNHVNTGDKLFTIAKTDPASVIFYLPEEAASFVDKHSAVQITPVEKSTVVLTGTVYDIGTDIDVTTHTLAVRAHVANPLAQMKGGPKVRVTVTTSAQDHVMLLSQKTIINQAGQNYIFVVHGNQVRLTEVTLGKVADGDRVTVDAHGVSVDDPVVLQPDMELKNDSFVKIKDLQNNPVEGTP